MMQYASTDFILAELLSAEGLQVELHTLENLVTHQAKKIWLSHDCLDICSLVRTSVRHLQSMSINRAPYLKKSSNITIATSLLLDIHVIVN